MLPDFNQTGVLPPGIHWANWDDLTQRYGRNPWRKSLLAGLKAALENLRDAGCRTAYIDGSFVTDKEYPNDYDACWEEAGVDPYLLDPALLIFDPGRETQKAKYPGELFRQPPLQTLKVCPFWSSSRRTGIPENRRELSPSTWRS